jgi:hypothetical protein
MRARAFDRAGESRQKRRNIAMPRVGPAEPQGKPGKSLTGRRNAGKVAIVEEERSLRTRQRPARSEQLRGA